MPSDQVMKKFKEKKLHSGSKKGPKVQNRNQAIAIMMSEKRAESKNGGKYPDKKKKKSSKSKSQVDSMLRKMQG